MGYGMGTENDFDLIICAWDDDDSACKFTTTVLLGMFMWEQIQENLTFCMNI